MCVKGEDNHPSFLKNSVKSGCYEVTSKTPPSVYSNSGNSPFMEKCDYVAGER